MGLPPGTQGPEQGSSHHSSPSLSASWLDSTQGSLASPCLLCALASPALVFYTRALAPGNPALREGEEAEAQEEPRAEHQRGPCSASGSSVAANRLHVLWTSVSPLVKCGPEPPCPQVRSGLRATGQGSPVLLGGVRDSVPSAPKPVLSRA